MRPDAWITSNTSSLPAARIFSELQHKNRATVTHFFAPAWRNPVVEVIDTPALDRAVLEDLRWLFCTTGKVPLVTADVPCFMLDRVFDNWCNEAAHLLDRASAAEIDSTAAEFVHAGPFFVLNLANGNPIIIETNTLQADEEGEHYRPAAIFRTAGTWNTVSPGKTVPVAPQTAAAIRDRLLGILMSQSGDILDRNIGGAADLELGCRLALGFKSGPLELMGKLGALEVARIGKRLVAERPGLPLPKSAPGRLPEFPSLRVGRRRARRENHHHPASRSPQRVARRADRRNPRRDPAIRKRPRGTRLRHHRLRPARFLGRRRYRAISKNARRCACGGAICARLLAALVAHRWHDQAGGRGAQRHGARRRAGTGAALPRYRGAGRCVAAIAGDHARHRARDRRHGGALSPLAEGSGDIPRHDAPRRAGLGQKGA